MPAELQDHCHVLLTLAVGYLLLVDLKGLCGQSSAEAYTHSMLMLVDDGSTRS
jgi:hypothetical protein